MHFHDLRRTFGTIALNEGESLEAVGEVLGHGDKKTTKRYAYVLPASVLHTAEAVADALSGKSKKQA